jgi:hypothetical protein
MQSQASCAPGVGIFKREELKPLKRSTQEVKQNFYNKLELRSPDAGTGSSSWPKPGPKN